MKETIPTYAEEVLPAHDFLTPPAAAIEDRTQPMGPLEKGDQALVDAVQAFPEGRQEIKHEDGSITYAVKEQNLMQDIVSTSTRGSDGSASGVSTSINKMPGISNVSGSIDQKDAGGSRAYVSGNTVGADVLKMQAEPNREKAQAIKLEIANKINDVGAQTTETTKQSMY